MRSMALGDSASPVPWGAVVADGRCCGRRSRRASALLRIARTRAHARTLCVQGACVRALRTASLAPLLPCSLARSLPLPSSLPSLPSSSLPNVSVCVCVCVCVCARALAPSLSQASSPLPLSPISHRSSAAAKGRRGGGGLRGLEAPSTLLSRESSDSCPPRRQLRFQVAADGPLLSLSPHCACTCVCVSVCAVCVCVCE
jgi:hypothetical protein